MSYNSESLGKRSFPSKSYNDFESGGGTFSKKKRDAKGMDSSSTRQTDHGQVSANAGDQDAGDYKNFPEIPERSVQNLKR